MACGRRSRAATVKVSRTVKLWNSTSSCITYLRRPHNGVHCEPFTSMCHLLVVNLCALRALGVDVMQLHLCMGCWLARKCVCSQNMAAAHQDSLLYNGRWRRHRHSRRHVFEALGARLAVHGDAAVQAAASWQPARQRVDKRRLAAACRRLSSATQRDLRGPDRWLRKGLGRTSPTEAVHDPTVSLQAAGSIRPRQTASSGSCVQAAAAVSSDQQHLAATLSTLVASAVMICSTQCCR